MYNATYQEPAIIRNQTSTRCVAGKKTGGGGCWLLAADTPLE